MTKECVESKAQEQTRLADNELRVVPDYKIYEEEDAYKLALFLPGVSKEHLDIELEDQQLTVKGQMRPPGLEGFELLHSEFAFTDFGCDFRLANGIDKEAIKAEFNDGCLSIWLPKASQAKRKKVAITI